jgi:hypothetical protein
MKQLQFWMLVLLIIISGIELKSQNLTFNELITLRTKSFDEIDQFLGSRYWRFISIDESNFWTKTVTWAYQKNDTKALAWFKLNLNSFGSNNIIYQTSTTSTINNIKSKMKELGYKSSGTSINEDRVVTNYYNKDYNISLYSVPETDDNPSYYVIEIFKKIPPPPPPTAAQKRRMAEERRIQDSIEAAEREADSLAAVEASLVPIEGTNVCVYGNCINGKGIYSYVDGIFYDGAWENGVRQGFGILEFKTGGKYEGMWEDDKYNGKGTLTMPDVFIYVGEFKDNNYNGNGTLTFASGTKYTGQFIDGKYHGYGTLVNINGTKYVGQFKDDYYDGYGILTFPDKTRQIGCFKMGEFVDVKIEGTNICVFGDCSNGQGIYSYETGTFYSGEWGDDKRNGYGYMEGGFEAWHGYFNHP